MTAEEKKRNRAMKKDPLGCVGTIYRFRVIEDDLEQEIIDILADIADMDSIIKDISNDICAIENDWAPNFYAKEYFGISAEGEE